MTHYDLNHAFMGCISLHHLFTFLIRRMSEYSKHEARIRLDEYMETYGSTNRIFDPEYSNIRIRSNKNAVHWIQRMQRMQRMQRTPLQRLPIQRMQRMPMQSTYRISKVCSLLKGTVSSSLKHDGVVKA